MEVNFPLTVKDLENCLRSIISELSDYKISTTLLKTLYSKSAGTVVTSIVGATTYSEIFDAINSNTPIKTDGNCISVVSVDCNAVESDDYKDFTIHTIGNYGDGLKRVTFGIENLGGAIRLHTKTVTTL